MTSHPLKPLVEALIYPPASTEEREEFLSHISNSIRAFRLKYGQIKTLKVIQNLAWEGYIPFTVEEVALHMAENMEMFFSGEEE